MAVSQGWKPVPPGRPVAPKKKSGNPITGSQPGPRASLIGKEGMFLGGVGGFQDYLLPQAGARIDEDGAHRRLAVLSAGRPGGMVRVTKTCNSSGAWASSSLRAEWRRSNLRVAPSREGSATRTASSGCSRHCKRKKGAVSGGANKA